jgi:hypothetical protein
MFPSTTAIDLNSIKLKFEQGAKLLEIVQNQPFDDPFFADAKNQILQNVKSIGQMTAKIYTRQNTNNSNDLASRCGFQDSVENITSRSIKPEEQQANEINEKFLDEGRIEQRKYDDMLDKYQKHTISRFGTGDPNDAGGGNTIIIPRITPINPTKGCPPNSATNQAKSANNIRIMNTDSPEDAMQAHILGKFLNPSEGLPVIEPPKTHEIEEPPLVRKIKPTKSEQPSEDAGQEAGEDLKKYLVNEAYSFNDTPLVFNDTPLVFNDPLSSDECITRKTKFIEEQALNNKQDKDKTQQYKVQQDKVQQAFNKDLQALREILRAHNKKIKDTSNEHKDNVDSGDDWEM